MVRRELIVPLDENGEPDWIHCYHSWHFDGEDDPEFWKEFKADTEKYKLCFEENNS